MSKDVQGGRVARRVVGAGVTAGVIALAAAGAAGAQPPDSCSAAAVMRAHAAAMTQMADYLDAHPDVQQVFSDAMRLGTPQERQGAITAYTDTHPDVAAAFRNIHQPVKDLSANCRLPMPMGRSGTGPGAMMPGGMMGMMPGQ